MNDYAIAFANLLNKLYETQGIPVLSVEQSTLLAVLLRELERPGPRKTAEQIVAAAERATSLRLLH